MYRRRRLYDKLNEPTRPWRGSPALTIPSVGAPDMAKRQIPQIGRWWHRERIRRAKQCELNRLWKKKNPEKVRLQKRRRHERNPEKPLEYVRRRREENPNEWRKTVRERTRRWRANNPDAERAIKARRRAKELNAEGTFTAADVREIGKLQRNRCARCREALKGKKVHLDHITPLARGGQNDRRNLQLLCAPCNLSKGDRDPIDDMRTLGLLL
jgi:5-methylcytosine-specific restriction endonuclease McrA